MRISDWSSDVCSSDLGFNKTIGEADGLGLFALDRVAEHQDFARHADADTLRQAPHQTIIRRQADAAERSEEHTSELQSLMRISYAVFCLKKKKQTHTTRNTNKQTRYTITNSKTAQQER